MFGLKVSRNLSGIFQQVIQLVVFVEPGCWHIYFRIFAIDPRTWRRHCGPRQGAVAVVMAMTAGAPRR